MAFKRDFRTITLALSLLYVSVLVLLAYMAEEDIIDRDFATFFLGLFTLVAALLIRQFDLVEREPAKRYYQEMVPGFGEPMVGRRVIERTKPKIVLKVPPEEAIGQFGTCEVCGRTGLVKFCNYCGKKFCEDHLILEKHNCSWLKEWA